MALVTASLTSSQKPTRSSPSRAARAIRSADRSLAYEPTWGILFEDGAVLDAGAGLAQARGADHIGALASALWERPFVADPRRVLQARDTALVVGERSIGVARRGADGAWRYAISLLFPDPQPSKEVQ